jgi:exodeoxyribonuclease V alpha subunit
MIFQQMAANLSHLNYHFSQFMCRIARTDSDALALASALVSYWIERGHICIDLNDFANRPLHESLDLPDPNIKDAPHLPAIDVWTQKLRNSGVVGGPGEKKPLILDTKNRLYLYRYYQYETTLLTQLVYRSRSAISGLYLSGLTQFLDKLFAQKTQQSMQRQAVEIAINKKLCIVSGGPGTGKTTVAAKMIAALIHVSESIPHIHLTAPTGKAAQRLQESLNDVKPTLDCSEEIISVMPSEAMTIHRLLKPKHRSPYFKHNQDNPLPSDVVIVDEASMIDLALMSKLVTALRKETRLIILGDKDQLASVDPGSVLGDICSQPKESSLKSCMVHLTKNYRFGESSGIYKAAQSVNEGNHGNALNIMGNKLSYKDIAWKDYQDIASIKKALAEKISLQSKYLNYQNNPRQALMTLNTFRILCAVRKGPFGVERLNHSIAEIMASKGLIQPNRQWYHGRPIMITKNDHRIGLYNGDVGLIFKDRNDQNVLKAFFIGSDNKLQKYLPARLPAHETVFAMTVHKSQGSEFDHVLLVLPDKLSKVLTRELVYTGITRTRKFIEIWGNRNTMISAIKNKIYRHSGLADALGSKRKKKSLD